MKQRKHETVSQILESAEAEGKQQPFFSRSLKNRPSQFWHRRQALQEHRISSGLA